MSIADPSGAQLTRHLHHHPLLLVVPVVLPPVPGRQGGECHGCTHTQGQQDTQPTAHGSEWLAAWQARPYKEEALVVPYRARPTLS